jgi:hypothetical protein
VEQQQQSRLYGAPQKLDFPPTRAGTLDGRSSGGLLPVASVRAEALVGDAAEQLELRKEKVAVAAGEGEAHKRDLTLVCGQGPLYRRAPASFPLHSCPGG